MLIKLTLVVILLAVAGIQSIHTWHIGGNSLSSERSHRIERRQLFGAFHGSGAEGPIWMGKFELWLGTRTEVAHTYLPGVSWETIEGESYILDPWASWQRERPNDLLVLNVPMAERNEDRVPDSEVVTLLRAGASGKFDRHYVTLARKLVAKGLGSVVIVPGWEMNGDTYSHRCGPDPRAWRGYFRSVVAAMRSVPGQNFRFDFTVSRGNDNVNWPECYPGDDVVDIIGMDSYDQAPGESFVAYVEQPLGLRAHINFARAHGKPVSYPEWGLWRRGDNPQFVREMVYWIRRQDAVYSTLTDYCPHGVFQCPDNPQSAGAIRELFG